MMYVAGALEHERPFLGPLYRFMSSSSEFGEARPGLRQILLVSPRDAATILVRYGNPFVGDGSES